MKKTNLEILEDLLYKVGKMSENDIGVVEFEVFSELLERLENPVRVNIWLNGEYNDNV
jgi:hypothetical protein